MSKNISRLSGRKGLEKNLFERLKSDVASEVLASDYHVGTSTVHSARSFYADLSDQKNCRIRVCNGSACLSAGTQDSLRESLALDYRDEEIGTITCLGRCYEARAYRLDGVNYSGDGKAVPSGQVPYSVVALQDNLLTSDYGIDAFARDYKTWLLERSCELLTELQCSGLRGRGGAGFPTALKWQTCRDAPGDRKYIVCNADEGDPGAYSDGYLMEFQTLKVIFGMLVAGAIAGATRGVIYLRSEYPEAIAATESTIKQLRDRGFLGWTTACPFDIQVSIGAGAYVCGEETSLLASIEGRRPEVAVRPPYPVIQGLYQRPTIVNNVETFAAVQGLLQIGGACYANIGTEKSTGTKLVSIDRSVRNPGVYEVPMGSSLRELINLAGGFSGDFKALQIGGPLGGIVPLPRIDDLTIDFESFSQHGYLLGHGSIVGIPTSMPIIDYLHHLFEFTAEESCGKCFPCRIGSVRGAEMMAQAINGEHRLDRRLLDDLLDTLEHGSLCGLGGGLPLPVRNALAAFSDELHVYFSAGGEK